MFEVGDLITGINNTRYSMTNNTALMEIKEIEEIKTSTSHRTILRVAIIKSLCKDFNEATHRMLFSVVSEYFRQATPEDLIRFN